jgi:hypothetical protein
MAKEFSDSLMTLLNEERRDESGHGRLDCVGRNRDHHKESQEGIEVPIVHRGKISHHKEMIQQTGEIIETDADKHQSCMPKELIPQPEDLQ